LKSKSTDPLDELLNNAQAIVAERNKMLEAIQATESKLAEANEDLRAAGERVAAEEFEAAQQEGGQAIASKATQQSLAEAELKAKSARLKLQGLRTQQEKIEADLFSAWERLQAVRDAFLQERAAELSEQADRAIVSIRGVICRALAFRRCAGGHFAEKYGHAMARMINSFVSNASSVIQGHRCSIQGGIFTDADGSKWALTGHWDRDAEALGLCEAIQGIDDRISPIGAVMSEVRPK